MFQITEPALKQLHDSLTGVAGGDDSRCFRITPKDESNLSLTYAEPTASDAKYDFNGRIVLAVPQELEGFCSDKRLDLDSDGKLELA